MQQKQFNKEYDINNLKTMQQFHKSSLNNFYKGVKIFFLLTSSFLGMLLAITSDSFIFFGVFFTLFCLISIDNFETKGN